MSAKVAISLVGQRRYWPLLVAQSLGAFNDNFFRYALVTLVAFQGLTVFSLDREVLVPIAASLFTVPMFLFSAPAGRLADRIDRAQQMRIMKFAEIWLMLTAAAGFILAEPLLLMVTLFFMGVQSAFFAPARNSALPTLLQPDELVAGNAMISGTLNISVLLGIGLGTEFIVRTQGPEIVGAGLVAMAVLGWLAMRQLPPARPEKETGRRPLLSLYGNWLNYPERLFGKNAGLRRMWNYICRPLFTLIFPLYVLVVDFVMALWRLRDHPNVARPLFGVAWFWMLAASIVTLMPNFAISVLGTDQTAVLLFSAIFVVGAAIGAILCGALSGKGDALPFSIAGALGLVIFTTDIAFLTWNNAPVLDGQALTPGLEFVQDPANRRLIIDLLLAAISAGLFVVPLQAMSQRRAPPELRGRILASGGILNALTATLGNFTLAALALLSLPLQSAFLYIAGVSLIVAIVAFVRMLKLRGQTPSPS